MNIFCGVLAYLIFCLNSAFVATYATDIIDTLTEGKYSDNKSLSKKCKCFEVEDYREDNAVGIAITEDGKTLVNGNKYLEFVGNKLYPENSFGNNVVYDESAWTLTNEFDGDILQMNTNYKHSGSALKITWVQKSTMDACISLNLDNQLDNIHLTVLKDGDSNSILSESLKVTDRQVTLRMKLNNTFLENSKYHLIIDRTSLNNSDSPKKLVIWRIAQCTDNNKNYEFYKRSINSGPKLICKEGSYYQNEYPPYDHKECSENKFGFNCSFSCSSKETGCQNLIFFTPFMKEMKSAFCASGYSGQYCDQKCKSGTYGRGCLKKCPDSCANTCEIYTGICP
ncbi:uncharacterized protein LOC126910314 isoform X2 [Daktulosphaira vitifoliae]|uniref:uncharacterized protein LOC126910314 isoform X2 n=1 Tax=Daktulosphaira vitifoliae TaxID=58002 RepID=UPI0021AA8615|nr:uncharacterized protein LOC126910314 isoform X2 [Daktulosphaira vitifoliae]